MSGRIGLEVKGIRKVIRRDRLLKLLPQHRWFAHFRVATRFYHFV